MCNEITRACPQDGAPMLMVFTGKVYLGSPTTHERRWLGRCGHELLADPYVEDPQVNEIRRRWEKYASV